MDRRNFLFTSTISLFAALSGLPKSAFPSELGEFENWKKGGDYTKDVVAPLDEITAAVDVLVPADPQIPGDFKGSDYHGDWVVASFLGNMGQFAAKMMLDKYARQVAGKKFLACTDEERLEAIKQWTRERDELSPTSAQLLTGVLTISMIGTYEDNTPEENLVLYESMGWYDPEDPAGTFRTPLEGYVDSYQFPAKLKKGLRK